MSPYYTVDQVAKLIDLHPKTVRRHIRSGRLIASKVGTQYRVSQSELNKFIGDTASNGQAATTHTVQTSAKGISANGVEVNTNVDIFGVDSAKAAFLTQRVLSVLNKLVDVRADCIYYDTQNKLKVLLFGNIESTDQMLKHINILINQANIQ